MGFHRTQSCLCQCCSFTEKAKVLLKCLIVHQQLLFVYIVRKKKEREKLYTEYKEVTEWKEYQRLPNLTAIWWKF